MTIASFLKLRCPVCEKARVFQGYLDTPTRCPACGFYFLRETGYFLPYAPIGYAMTVLLALAAWPILEYGAGIHSDAVIVATMIAIVLGFGLWSARYAKLIWLAFDLWLHPATKEDFEPRGRQ